MICPQQADDLASDVEDLRSDKVGVVLSIAGDDGHQTFLTLRTAGRHADEVDLVLRTEFDGLSGQVPAVLRKHDRLRRQLR